MARISQGIVMETMRRGAVSILLVLGTALAFYNAAAFRTDKYGLYFKDDNQLWLAIGVAMLAAAWLLRNWKKL